jgi:pilus assembly protein TadC
VPPTLWEASFAAATAVSGYVVMARPAFLPPMRRLTRSTRPPSRMRALVGHLFADSAASSSGLLTATGAVLAVPSAALGLVVRSPLLALFLGSGVFLLPGWLRRCRHAGRRRELLLELGDSVEYLELHFAAGATVPDAIGGTAAFLVGPLGGELRRVLARAALLQDGSRALDELAERVADPDLTAVARRLSAAWRLRAPGPDTFAGFGDTLRHIRETHIAAQTKTLPVVYVAIAGWMIFALVAIIAVPVGTAFLHSLSSF